MGSIFTTYKLQCVKEKAAKYEMDKKVSEPRDAYKILNTVFDMENQSEEVLTMLALNTKNVVVGAFEVSRGSLNSSIVHPREIFKRALLVNAASIVVAHNHPSGDPSPSNEDINVTHRIKESGRIIGIELLDHIIIVEGKYLSLKEKGIL